MRSELAVELGEQHDAIGEAKLGAFRHERGILRRRGAVDDEARAGERLKQGDERRVAHPIVRPGDARAQRERRLGIEQQQPIEASAQLAPRVGRVARIEAKREAAAVEIGLAIARRVEPLGLDRRNSRPLLA